MQNLKIRVNNKAESREVQELFFELGYEWHGAGKSVSYLESIASDEFGYLVAWKPGCFSKYIIQMGCGKEDAKEITLPELRNMVNPMKEYLVKNIHGEYVVVDHHSGFDMNELIEIPDGAIRARFYQYDPDALEFENSACQWWGDEAKKWIDYMDYSKSLRDSRVVWQRATNPEELPFIDDEPKYTDDEVNYMDENGQGRFQSMNDQYAEIEQVRQSAIKVSHNPNQHPKEIQKSSIEGTLAERQSTYGNFEDVAFVTENIMSILAKVRVNGLDDLPNTHRMALYMIASKMARIVNGDFNHLDSWHDIGGYAKLIEKLIKGE